MTRPENEAQGGPTASRGDGGMPAGAVPAGENPLPGGSLPARASKTTGGSGGADLAGILRRRFGFASFRPFQEAVCRTVCAGRDALLVMPTGAGKSLCYQLPGLVRGGTTLVVSPLIALMEDQVGKLAALGLRAEAIHSGRGREHARAACARFLADQLDFIFIAPERLSIPGFPEMLARRPLALVAVDEAHCISHWGHDFRPDYRLLRHRLPALRPAPVLALTATATPRVQEDIVAQLGMREAVKFVHGFRRTNISVEVVRLRPSHRAEAVLRLVADRAFRPAIVYSPTRRETEELAAALASVARAAPYHAGLSAERREETQAAFLGGDLEVIVATIAFGMGVDKPDVRTVIHTAMPGSVEGYYQEIGRAGRDGLPARAVLFYGWADRKVHESFLKRDYPEEAVLRRVVAGAGSEWRLKLDLAARARLETEVLEVALNHLRVHGALEIDPEENVRRAGTEPEAWVLPYGEQRRQRLEDLDFMVRFTESRGCRMLRLVRHFGDREDAGEPCGRCDFCDPRGCAVLRFRPPTPAEREAMERGLAELGRRGDQATGRLHQQLFGAAMGRSAFEDLLRALVRARLIVEREDAFEKEGRRIAFLRVSLTAAGRHHPELATVPMEDEPAALPSRSSAAAGRAMGAATSRGRGRERDRQAMPDGAGVRAAGAFTVEARGRDVDPARVEALRAWRLGEARRLRQPAFRILTDRTLMGIAAARPRTEAELLAVRGMGPGLVRRFGRAILEVVRAGGAQPPDP